MALANVIKIQLIAHKKVQSEITETLQDSGFVQVDELIEAENKQLEKINLTEKISQFDYQLAGIRFSLDFLNDYVTEKKSLVDKLNPTIVLSPGAFEKVVQDFDYQGVTKEVQRVETKINEAKNQIDKAQDEITQLEPWRELNFITHQNFLPKNFSFTAFITNQEIYNQLANELQKAAPLSELQKVNQDKKEIRAIIIFKKDWQPKITEILTELNISSVEIPELEVTISQRLKDLNWQISDAENKIRQLEDQAAKLAHNIPDLKIIFDHLTWQRDQFVHQQKAGYSDQTFSLIGWVDKNLISTLEKKLNKVTNDFTVDELEVKDDEVVPVILKNKMAEPFETVTKLYGAPQSHEVDPTPFLAPFFTLFFGMAMTDAGYGLVMAGTIYAAIKFLKIPRQKQKLFRVLIWGGIATFILGALTGGWFGVDLKILPPAIGQPLMAIQLVNPVENPLIIFYISLGLGVFQVLTGLAINTWWKIKSQQVLDGILGSGAWFFTLVSLLLFAGGKMALLPEIIGEIGKWMSLFGALVIVYNGTRGTKNLFLKPGLGILSLYGVVGYFSDILSYSRLLALGLTTGIIGMVVNVIAGLVFGIPWIGWLMALIVLIGGHTFNLVVNALGAFIHSSRLQFIEFFPKFFEAGGELFEPFKKQSQYIKVTNN